MQPIKGLHHITAVTGDPQANLDFYRQVLGQRFIKRTVNFDDPGTYHFYFGDYQGTPGTVLTFFPWTHVAHGRRGSGETAAMAYTIHADSLEYWRARLNEHSIPFRQENRFGDPLLALVDPDGMTIELVASDPPPEVAPWTEGPIPQGHELRGFHSVTLWLAQVEPTAQLLMDHMGYAFVGREGERYRYQVAQADLGMLVDILHKPGYPYAQFGGGSIHHVAFRTRDNAEQLQYLDLLRAAGQRVTPVQDRQYFHSIYFRTPGGVLFEIATDGPGFTIDEPLEKLGSSLRLPPWFEAQRAQIETTLPRIELTPIEQAQLETTSA